MNQLEQAINNFGPLEINKKMHERRIQLGRIAIKPPVDGLFNKTHKYPSFISGNLCRWIIDKSEEYANNNGGWTKTRHKNYPTTDLPVKSINSISIPIYNLTVMNILPLIAKHYKMNLFFLNIVDLFVIKYDVNGQDHLNKHRDGSIISFNILLNDEFEGGGTIIDHINDDEGTTETLYTSEKGDLFIHSGKLLHGGNKITSGCRYILVGFVEFCSKIYLTSETNTTEVTKNETIEKKDSETKTHEIETTKKKDTVSHLKIYHQSSQRNQNIIHQKN